MKRLAVALGLLFTAGSVSAEVAVHEAHLFRVQLTGAEAESFARALGLGEALLDSVTVHYPSASAAYLTLTATVTYTGSEGEPRYHYAAEIVADKVLGKSAVAVDDSMLVVFAPWMTDVFYDALKVPAVPHTANPSNLVKEITTGNLTMRCGSIPDSEVPYPCVIEVSR